MKVISSHDAAALPADGWTVSTSGFTGSGHPEGITTAIENRFLESGRPRALTLIYAAGQGDRDKRGTGRFGHEGLVKRIIGGHRGAAPRLGTLAEENKVEAYNWPQGVIAQLYRAIAGGKPGVISQIGLHTFIDPRQDGERANALAVHAMWIGLSAGALYTALMLGFGPAIYAALGGRGEALDQAAIYFHWAGPCYGLFGLGLCLYFSSLGAGKVGGPVLAGTLRLVLIAIGGWILAAAHTPPWTIFALVAFGMAAYGLASVIAVRYSNWGIER